MLPKLLRLALYGLVAWAMIALVRSWFRPQLKAELDRGMRIASGVLLLAAVGALGWHLSR
ncbi:protein MIGRI [Chitinolyticbacter albus]|uniref:protein MIGRI n=1 Tax=Chitinolyticbacter albus TaxID=2961951 RepID=UPI00210A9E2B|nr:hypothetical protein [Chitinolyticbacter albus]